MAKQDNIQISLRLSEDIHKKLTAYATAANLSLNAVAIQAIQKLIEPDDIKQRLLELEQEVSRLRQRID